jgi:hypothetical protein
MPSVRSVVFIFVFLILFLLPAGIFARDIEIYVEDEELGLPLEGAVVSLRSGRQFICDAEGRALISIADERQQVVQITYPGYDTRRVTVPAASGDAPVRITAALRLSGVMQGRELVVEAQRPESSETKSGRSVAISERELAQTAEIGIIEDVMSSVKLLPGVGYTGMFGAMPSIRGGDPGDLVASFDGFYLERPYHWIGAVSIFDPKMVSNARLSHGVFSSRYGHTTSGLLEITSKSPSATEVEMETGISTSAVSLNLSYPLGGRGGVLFMGKVTYWDAYIGLLKGLSRVTDSERLAMINSVSTAPYIRSAALAVDYRFGPSIDWRLNLFFGSDGVGAEGETEYDDDDVKGHVDIIADYNNYQGFLISGITASPSPVVALKATGGVGFIKTVTDDLLENDITVTYNDDFLASFPDKIAEELRIKNTYTAPGANIKGGADHTILSAQGRVDADWEVGKGFIAAFGIQELYSLWAQKQYVDLFMEMPLVDERTGLPAKYAAMLPPEYDFLTNPDDPHYNKNAAIIWPMNYHSDLLNHGLTSSLYGLVEYSGPGQRFGAELGLRVDHLYLRGKGFSTQTMPALNPRLNIDINILKNKGILDSLDFTVGTGLFSSINEFISFIEDMSWLGGYNVKFNRSWTSVAGFKADWAQGYSFNIEGYYKRIFDRAYITADFDRDSTVDTVTLESPIPSFHFDGIGNVAGFDLQLQKLESRYVDGWISYTFTWAKYYDPSAASGLGISNNSIITANDWYYPSFHRFHNCNIVLNIKPSQVFGISTRFGFASGQLRTVSDRIYSYPVIYTDTNGETVIVQKYRRDELYEEEVRASWNLPWDIKFSFYPVNRKGRTNTEIYLAVENLMSLFYRPQDSDNTRFNEYTGRKDSAGSGTSGFDLPIPMASFGFKWKY